ncbi:5-deoxy-glucuronate isomerase [Arthrobacter sp. 18067]|uniref:5-deoxy-glucuronate isomerase n=1 Tax=Arthrobacter sp. 18067 TaxID=2681413 RepID=UPI00135B6E37|nr:5-deoxy-glucuronate isomerase [Arthrobacter sp. 18067]
MTDWFHPSGSAGDGPWEVSLGTSDSPAMKENWDHTGIKVATLAVGEQIVLDAAPEERLVVPLSGSFDATVEGTGFFLRGRESVFSGPTDVLFAGAGTELTLTSQNGGRVAVTTAFATKSYPARLIPAENVPVLMRGAGNCLRQVHNFGMPEALEADRILVCEVYTPAGNWSSYPPHKHDTEQDGETALEEIYYYETQPAENSSVPEGVAGVAYQHVYASDDRPIDVATEVRSGDVVLVPYGWHGPAMAPPGFDLYYLNVMAGPGPVRNWLINDDPDHGWIRATWEGPEPEQLFPRPSRQAQAV